MRFRISAICLAVTVAAIAPAMTGSAAAAPVKVRPAIIASPSDGLFAIAATSPDAIWTAGQWHDASDSEQALVQRWNGKAWKLVPSPEPAGANADNELIGLATISPTKAWLDGTYWNGTNWQSLIEHWNGKAWRKVASPDPGGASNRNILQGIAVTSRSSAWAVGYYDDSSSIRHTMILHWNGRTWKLVASPSPGGAHDSELTAVTVVSPSSAWAVGDYFTAAAEKTLILHWNGKSWRTVASPSPDAHGCSLSAVAPVSPKAALAVGACWNGTHYRTLILQWNGKTWKHIASPDPGGSAKDNELSAVVPVSRSDAWAFGYIRGKTTSGTVILHWNGRTWRTVSGPNPGKGGELFAATAVSPSSIWAVGDYLTSGGDRTLIEHWNGTVWRRVASPNK